MNENELYHYGVKGMRWGQRKAILKADYYKSLEKANGNKDKIAKAKTDYKNKLKAEKTAYKNDPETIRRDSTRKAGMMAAGGALAAIGTTAVVLAPVLPGMIFMGALGSAILGR